MSENQYIKDNVKEYSDPQTSVKVEEENNTKKGFKINKLKLTKWAMILVQFVLVAIERSIAKTEPATMKEGIEGSMVAQIAGAPIPTKFLTYSIPFLVLGFGLAIAYFWFIHRKSKRSFGNRLLLTIMFLIPTFTVLSVCYDGKFWEYRTLLLEIYLAVVAIIGKVVEFFKDIITNIKL